MRKRVKSREKSGDIIWTVYSDGTATAEARGATGSKLERRANHEGIPASRLLIKALEEKVFDSEVAYRKAVRP